jgi:hypothetical protein
MVHVYMHMCMYVHMCVHERQLRACTYVCERGVPTYGRAMYVCTYVHTCVYV